MGLKAELTRQQHQQDRQKHQQDSTRAYVDSSLKALRATMQKTDLEIHEGRTAINTVAGRLEGLRKLIDGNGQSRSCEGRGDSECNGQSRSCEGRGDSECVPTEAVGVVRSGSCGLVRTGSGGLVRSGSGGSGGSDLLGKLKEQRLHDEIIAELKGRLEEVEQNHHKHLQDLATLRMLLIEIHLNVPVHAVRASRIGLRSSELSKEERKAALSSLEAKEQQLRANIDRIRERNDQNRDVRGVSLSLKDIRNAVDFGSE